MDDQRLRSAIAQWRDSLVSLSGRNRLINYRPTRSSTLEFTQHDSGSVFEIIRSPSLTFTKGTRPPEKESKVDAGGDPDEDLEAAVLDQIQDFNPEDFPDHLFADKTQRDVDKALRNLASASKRELLDKGLRVLYLALGELRWTEDSGDLRRSPLLLVPIELDSLGPRERMFMRFSDDDMAVNPALALRLAEDYGLTLPSLEEVLLLIEGEGINGAIDRFRTLDYPQGWEVRDFAALSTFMFAKEAMYRDLLDNENRVAASGLIQALSGASGDAGADYLFEPYGDQVIDEVAPPEVSPLVIDADASQRAAVQAAVEGKSFTLDGPPGTGKSQTIANMIAALMGEGKSVLFVSEKAVALDVVRDRLAERGLGPFLFELHSSKAARKEVALRLGEALAYRPVAPTGMSATKIEQLREARRALTEYVTAVNEVRSPLGASVHQAIGWLEQSSSAHVGPDYEGDALDLSPGTLAEIEALIPSLERTWALGLEGQSSTWYGLREESSVAFLLSELRASLSELAPYASDYKIVRLSLAMEGISDLPDLQELLAAWHAQPQYQEDSWLDLASFSLVPDAIASYGRAVAQRAERLSVLEGLVGDNWQELPLQDATKLMALLAKVGDDLDALRESTRPELEAARLGKAHRMALLEQLRTGSAELAVAVGVKPPRTTEELSTLLVAINSILSAGPMLAAWIYDSQARTVLRDAVEVAVEYQAKLDDSAERARVFFGEATLHVDLAELERLADDTRSLRKRFSSDHRRMRVLLQSISVAKWKVAREMLPLAREWANSHRLFLDAEAKVTANLGNLSQRESRPDYLQIRRALAAAEAAIPAGFKAVAATERFLSDGEYQANWQDAALTLERRCIEWREGGDEGAVPDLDHAPFEQTAADLERQLGLLADADELFDMQSHVLGAEATFGQNIDGALARLHFEEDHLAAQERRAELEALLQLPPDSLGLELGAEVPLRDHSNWARRVLELSRVPDGQPLTKDQLRVLRSTDPFYGVEAPVERYLSAKQKLLAAFDSGRAEELSLDLDNVEVAGELIDLMNSRLEEIDDWFELQSANESSERLGLSAALNHARRQALPVSELGRYLKSTVYRTWLNLQIQADPRLVSPSSARRDQIVDEFRRLDTEIAQSAVARIIESASARRPKSSVGQAALIRREAEKKRRHIPVRDLIGQARDVILAMHPCFMMSPLAVSQYLPPEEMFDVVIFDEASQVMPADSINCIYRARAVVTAGDQKQLPPTSFFEATTDESDDADDEDLANDYESILDLMKSSGAFTAQSLRWHYRSRHEHLIAYSNASFYQSRLITFPSAVSESDDIGVRFFKVPGVYRRSAARDNPVEARHVAERVIHHFDTRPGQSLGVVAFSVAQRDAIDAAVDLARGERPDLDGYFTDERGSGFFVKSLESVQGDERDVIIFSIGYGPDENGKIYRTFGPVSRNGGERRLNVAVTRAKRLVEVVSSMSASDIGEVGSEGGRHLRRYLDFAERGPVALSLELGPDGLETESPFEDAVLDYVRGLGFEVQPQVGVAGYRIDLGVKHPNQPGAFMLGIECDGAAYHSSKAARDRDRIRHQVLEGLGWNIHHIWGTAWYRHPEKEKQRLKKLLEEAASRPVSGRLSPQRPAPVSIAEPVELGFVEHRFDVDPDWVTDYAVAEVERIPYRIDLSDTGNGMWLRRFVEAVARVEAPLHFDVLMLRLRENSQYDRIGSKIRQTLVRAAKLADVEFDGEWIRRGQNARVVVRRPAGGFTRTVSQVPEEELQSAIVSLVTDAVGVRQSDLVVAVASIFGWRRTGPDIRTRLEEVVAGMLERGTLIESSGGLSLGR